MEEVECPYCEKNTEISPDEHYENYDEYECEHCHKNFEVLADPYIHYSVLGKADCLNGGEHKWKPMRGAPEIYFKGKYRCEDCSAEHTVKSELATKDEWDEHWEN